jgi:hypothetical protein
VPLAALEGKLALPGDAPPSRGAYAFYLEEEEEEEEVEDEMARYLDPGSPWRNVGTLQGSLLARPSTLFQEMSDCVSQELYDTCQAMCDGRGILRYDAIDGLERFADNAASVGYMLHVDKVRINNEHRGGALQVESS